MTSHSRRRSWHPAVIQTNSAPLRVPCVHRTVAIATTGSTSPRWNRSVTGSCSAKAASASRVHPASDSETRKPRPRRSGCAVRHRGHERKARGEPSILHSSFKRLHGHHFTRLSIYCTRTNAYVNTLEDRKRSVSVHSVAQEAGSV